MGFLSDLVGGSDRSASRDQKKANNQIKAFAVEQNEASRNDLFNLWPQGDASRREGYQSALDLLSGTLQPTINPMVYGNVAAQNYLRGGMMSANNAILGRPQQMGWSMSRHFNPNLTPFQGHQIPQGVDYGQQQPQVPNYQSLLSGWRGF